jgi:hypothetical protein
MRTREERLLEYFLDHEGQAINTFVLERIAGRRAWRSRVSGARRTLRRDILNSQQRVYKGGRLRHVNSFYTLVKIKAA